MMLLVVVTLFCFNICFGFFGHPEVYVIIIPVFGLISSLLDILYGRFVYSVIAMIYSFFSIFVLGFFV